MSGRRLIHCGYITRRGQFFGSLAAMPERERATCDAVVRAPLARGLLDALQEMVAHRDASNMADNSIVTKARAAIATATVDANEGTQS